VGSLRAATATSWAGGREGPIDGFSSQGKFPNLTARGFGNPEVYVPAPAASRPGCATGRIANS
jgi:hypothetical protein